MNHKLGKVEQQFGNLHDVIPKLVNEKGQHGAGQELGVSGSTINKWLRDNGYRQVVRYVKWEITDSGRALLQEMSS